MSFIYTSTWNARFLGVFCTCDWACDFSIGMLNCCIFVQWTVCAKVWLWRAQSKCFTSHSLANTQWKWMAWKPIPHRIHQTLDVVWRKQIVEIFCSVQCFEMENNRTLAKRLQIRAVEIAIERIHYFKFKFYFSADTNTNASKESNRTKWSKRKWYEWISGKVLHNERRTDKRLIWFSTENLSIDAIACVVCWFDSIVIWEN